MSQTETTSSAAIAVLNDRLRKTFVGGRVLMTQGIQALSVEVQQAIIQAVQAFDTFNEDNDPYVLVRLLCKDSESTGRWTTMTLP